MPPTPPAVRDPSRGTRAADVYRRHQDSLTPWVQRAILDGIATLPTAAVATLTPLVVKLVTRASGWIDIDKVLNLTERLSAAGEIRSTTLLLTALFLPRAGAEEKMVIGTRARLVASIEDDHYRERFICNRQNTPATTPPSSVPSTAMTAVM